MEEKRSQNQAGVRTEGSRSFSEFVILLKGFGVGTKGRNLFLWWVENGVGSVTTGFLGGGTGGTSPGEGMKSALVSRGRGG